MKNLAWSSRGKEGSTDLYKALKEEGFDLPEECGDIELLMPVDGVFQLRFITHVTGERLEQLGRALVKLGAGFK